jgi:cation diffusion facilitator CzcD-associated flavoprotein CzcO
VASSGGLDTDVVVIGAGPYGLSVSAHLSARGVRHEIFGETMELWSRHMPAGMYLKSEGFASNLSDPHGEHTLERYCAEHEREYEYRRVAAPIPVDTFERYGRWFQERLVPRVRNQRVERVRKGATGTGFELQLSTGETLRAKRVVVASGMSGVAYVPSLLNNLPPELLVHAYDCREPARYSGEEVAVLGAGQSALEAAALLHEQGAHVCMIVRASQLRWNSQPVTTERSLRERLRQPISGLGDTQGLWVYANYPLAFYKAPRSQKLKRAYTVLGPAGAWWLRTRIENQFEIMLERSVVEAQSQGDGVRLKLAGPDGAQQEVSVSRVLAGTGYQPDLNLLEFVDPELRREIATFPQTAGAPVLDSHFQSSSVDGLHFVGYLAGLSFGPVMRFVYGADFAARRVARAMTR